MTEAAAAHQVQEVDVADGGFREVGVDFWHEVNEEVDVVFLTLPHVVHQTNVLQDKKKISNLGKSAATASRDIRLM